VFSSVGLAGCEGTDISDGDDTSVNGEPPYGALLNCSVVVVTGWVGCRVCGIGVGGGGAAEGVLDRWTRNTAPPITTTSTTAAAAINHTRFGPARGGLGSATWVRVSCGNGRPAR
jgi:hypothetical protein